MTPRGPGVQRLIDDARRDVPSERWSDLDAEMEKTIAYQWARLADAFAQLGDALGFRRLLRWFERRSRG